MQLAATAPDAPVRPLPGMYFLVDGESPPVCRDGQNNPDRCEVTAHWLQAIITLTRDLFGGSQHILTDSS